MSSSHNVMKMITWRKVVLSGGLALMAFPVTQAQSTAGEDKQTGGVQVVASAAAAPSPVDPEVQPARIMPSAEMNLPSVLGEVARLTAAKVDESVILAYVQNSSVPYQVTADQLIYLKDLGVGPAILQALVDHSGSKTPVVAPAVVASSPKPPEAAVVAVAAPSTTPVLVQSPDVHYFYDALSPYGNWLEVPDYGWCWQPTVAAVTPSWAPYCDEGYWLYTDCGWYWHSNYSWGWGPFHYGRWAQLPRYGWVWCPDKVWGPAWVCWRNSPDYCGWAPLPPGAHFAAGIGWSFRHATVGINFDFGLAPSCFTFVTYRNFCDPHVYAHRLPPREVNRFFAHTTVVNNYVMDDHHRIINHGIGRERIEAVTHARIREVTVRELPAGGQHSMRPDRIETVGHAPVVYRPGPSYIAPRSPGRVPERNESRNVRENQQFAAPPPSPVISRPVGRNEIRATPSAQSPVVANHPAQVRPTEPLHSVQPASPPTTRREPVTPGATHPSSVPAKITPTALPAGVPAPQPQREVHSEKGGAHLAKGNPRER
jgi:hypothetical protein